MKKVLAILISISLMLTLCAGIIYGETVEIGHSVPVITEFAIEGKNITKFTGTTAVEVANVIVKNNTRDGYSVRLYAEHGVLHSDSSANGEADIPYVLSQSTSGSSPSTAGGFKSLTIPSTPPLIDDSSDSDGEDNGFIILGNASALSGNNLLNKPTDLEFTVKVAITDSSFIKMAGTYYDTLHLVYTDL